jgi:hypothetical protein
MKTKQNIPGILLVFLVFTSINLSCHSVKKAVSCPEISIKKNEYRAHHKVRSSQTFSAHKINLKNQNTYLSKKSQKKETLANIPVINVDKNSGISKIEFNNSLIASIDSSFRPITDNAPLSILLNNDYKNIIQQNTCSIQEAKCDTIVLKSGTIIIGKVEEIGVSELKYRRCNNLNGPVISMLKTDVSKIIYSNGTSDLFGPTEMYIPSQTSIPKQNSSSYNNYTPLKTEGLGLAGFISGIVGLFIASIPLGIIAVVFGGIVFLKFIRILRDSKVEVLQ